MKRYIILIFCIGLLSCKKSNDQSRLLQKNIKTLVENQGKVIGNINVDYNFKKYRINLRLDSGFYMYNETCQYYSDFIISESTRDIQVDSIELTLQNGNFFDGKRQYNFSKSHIDSIKNIYNSDTKKTELLNKIFSNIRSQDDTSYKMIIDSLKLDRFRPDDYDFRKYKGETIWPFIISYIYTDCDDTKDFYPLMNIYLMSESLESEFSNSDILYDILKSVKEICEADSRLKNYK